MEKFRWEHFPIPLMSHVTSLSTKLVWKTQKSSAEQAFGGEEFREEALRAVNLKKENYKVWTSNTRPTSGVAIWV